MLRLAVFLSMTALMIVGAELGSPSLLPLRFAVAAEAQDPMPLEQAREMGVKSPVQATRLQAIAVLGERGSMADVPVLVQALRDPDEETRGLAERAVWQVFHRSGDAEADRLTQKGIQRMQQGDLPEAVELFSKAVARAPNFAEAYNKRATTYYLMGRFKESIEDCERTLALNRWHFGALSGAGLNYINLSQPRKALEFFERALAVYPHLEGARRNAEMLREHLQRNAL